MGTNSRHRTSGNPGGIDRRVIEACAFASNRLGGPRLTRLGVTSSVRGEGRSTVAAAMALAQDRLFGRSALLVDLDFDEPGLAELFDLPNGPGVAEVLRGRASVGRAMHAVSDNLQIMPAGGVDGDAGRLAQELLASSFLNELQDHFSAVIADLPPLSESVAGPLLAGSFAQTLLVVRAEVTPISKVRDAIAPLERAPMVLMNATRTRLPRWLQSVASR